MAIIARSLLGMAGMVALAMLLGLSADAMARASTFFFGALGVSLAFSDRSAEARLLAGVPVEMVAQRLGHPTLSTTHNLYTHTGSASSSDAGCNPRHALTEA